MKYRLQNTKRVLLLLFLVFILSGCSSLKSLDQKLGETFFNEKKKNISEEISKEEKKEIKNLNPKDLDIALKKKIDDWLKENNLNRYGDPEGTYYIGGTPLFDEKTGKSIERFEYIFQKIPGILEKIK